MCSSPPRKTQGPLVRLISRASLANLGLFKTYGNGNTKTIRAQALRHGASVGAVGLHPRALVLRGTAAAEIDRATSPIGATARSNEPPARDSQATGTLPLSMAPVRWESGSPWLTAYGPGVVDSTLLGVRAT